MRSFAWAGILGLLAGVAGGQAAAQTVDPYQNYNYKLPASWKGPSYKLSHDYPKTLPKMPADPPWLKVSGGKHLTQDNALAYATALKDYIAKDMKVLILDPEHWDAAQAGWYDVPWLFWVRDSVHGTYVGSQFPRNTFPLSGLKKDMTTYVVVYYNDIAGYTLGQLWGDTAMDPDVSKGQFQEGAIIIKAAFTSATPADWSPLDGSQKWTLYGSPNGPGPVGGTPPPRSSSTRRSSSSTSSSRTRRRPRRRPGCSPRWCMTRPSAGPSGTG